MNKKYSKFYDVNRNLLGTAPVVLLKRENYNDIDDLVFKDFDLANAAETAEKAAAMKARLITFADLTKMINAGEIADEDFVYMTINNGYPCWVFECGFKDGEFQYTIGTADAGAFDIGDEYDDYDD